MVVQGGSVVPKYYQLEQALRARVARLKVGTAIPPEVDLCKEYGVSRTTVRLAVDALVAEGLLQRLQGKGTFVGASKVEFSLGRWRLPGTRGDSYRVLGKGCAPAGEELAELFGISESTEVLRVQRVYYQGRVPMRYGELVIAPAIRPIVECADFSQKLFYETLIEQGVEVAKHRVVVEAGTLDAAMAAELGVRPGLPSIDVTRYVLGPDGRAVAVIHLVTRGDVGRYVLELPEDPSTESRGG